MEEMNLKKISFVLLTAVLIVISLFSLTSCSGASTGSKVGINTNTQQLEQSLKIGTQGVTLEFQPNMPPMQVYQGEDFSLGVLVSNRGVSNINDLQFMIGSYDTTFLDVNFKPLATNFGTQIEKGNTPNAARVHYLSGKSISLPEGSKELIAFTVSPHRSGTSSAALLPPGDSYTPRFTATACYQYKTEFTSSVCVNPFYNDPLYVGPGCDMSTMSVSGGQGAPVAITKVEPFLYTPDKSKILQYKIHLSNVGGGELFDNRDWTYNCNPQGDAFTKKLQEILNIVTVKAYLGTTALKCYTSYDQKGSTEPITLQLGKSNNGEGDVIICTADISQVKASYTSVLTVDAAYGYSQKVTGTTKIKRTSDYMPSAQGIDNIGTVASTSTVSIN